MSVILRGVIRLRKEILLRIIDEASSFLSILFGQTRTQDAPDLQVRLHACDQHHDHPDDHTSERDDRQRYANQCSEPQSQCDLMSRVEGSEQERRSEQDSDANPPWKAIHTAAVTSSEVSTSEPTNVAPVVRSSRACV